ncbi:kinase-like domain-containing protein [Trichoderma ceciliae]
MASITDLPAGDMKYFVLSAANEAAIHLLSEIQRDSSPPTLKSDENTIGYHLSIPSLDSRQREFCFKWSVGAGPSPNIAKTRLDRFTPDILLCPQGPTPTPSSKAVRASIKHIHAIISLHPRSGTLVLRSRSSKPIIYEQGDMYNQNVTIYGEAGSKLNSCVLRRKKNYLQFGPYRFLLEFTVSHQDQDEFSKRIDRCLHGRHHNLLNFIPTTNPRTLWNVWLHHRVPNSSSIQSGVHIYTGQPVAVKTLQNKTKTRLYTIERLKLASQYKDRPDKGILGIINTWCEHRISPPCVLKTSGGVDHCRNTYFSMPLAEQNFLHTRWKKLDTETHIDYLYHTLCGLADLHSRGVVHGNIRPESLLIHEQRAFISLCMQQTETPDTSICVAPEVWLGNNPDLDETKLDIWGLAASWLYTCLNAPPDLKMTRQSYSRLQVTLDSRKHKGHIQEPLYGLLQQMLAWDPRNRPSVMEALKHEAWLPILTPVAVETRKRKQTQTNQESQSKKVRVLISRHQSIESFKKNK